MDEKIKISISKTTLEVLQKDCADFKIYKENGSPNMNAFINTLIVNYYESFSASEETLHNDVKSALSIVPNYYKDKVFSDIIKILTKKSELQDGKRQTTTFSFKPTKFSEKALIYIENFLIKDESISSFYRRLFTSYTQKVKNEREKIIHKENHLLLQKAIKQNVQVCIKLQTGKVKTLSIYSISPAKEELFNYVLGFDGDNNITMRLATIKSVSLLPTTSLIPDFSKALFDKQIACAPQYPMYYSDNQPIKVELTENGKKMFEKIYLYRPTPTKIEGNVYTFECSASQLLFYFERFGNNALILSPKKLGIFMRNYYYYALKKYKTLYDKD